MKKSLRKLWSIMLVFALVITGVALQTASRTAGAAGDNGGAFKLYFYCETDKTLYLNIWNHAGIEFASGTDTSTDWGWDNPQGILKAVNDNPNWYVIDIDIKDAAANDGFDIYNGGSADADKVATYDNQWNNTADYALLVGKTQEAYAVKGGVVFADLSAAGLNVGAGGNTTAPLPTLDEAKKNLQDNVAKVPADYKNAGYTADSVASLTLAADAADALLKGTDTDVTKFVAASDALVKAIDGLVFSSNIYVNKVNGIDDDFIRGVDISIVQVEYESGVKYYDFDGTELFLEPAGNQKGFFTFLKECGINWVRLRVWNDPYCKDDKTKGYGGGNNDVAKAKTMGKAATDAGLKVLIDFHYSDFWADPAKQMVPKAWADYDLNQKKTALSEFTKSSLNELIDAGVDVEMVQVGNEENNGLAGVKDLAGKYALISEGSKAVREVAAAKNKNILVAVHYTDVHKEGYFDNVARELKENNVDYDVFAASYYPFWHGTTENLTSVMKKLAKDYGKKVMVAETSYAYTLEDGDGSENSVHSSDGLDAYDISVQGQANAVADVIDAVSKMGDAGLGVFYWEPSWIPVQVYDKNAANAADVLASNRAAWEKYGSGWASSCAAEYDPEDAGKWYGGSSWDNQAMFDFNGKPLESINVYKYVFSGTNAANTLRLVKDISHTVISGTDWAMPETVKAKYTDDSEKDVAVTWNESEVEKAKAAGVGEFNISGTVTVDQKSFDVKCALTVKQPNLLRNPGFEEDDTGMWSIAGDKVYSISGDDPYSGNRGLHFYNAEAAKFTAEQQITLNKGTYAFSAYIQGAKAKGSLYAKVGTKEIASDEVSLTGWLEWKNPEIAKLEITADNTVVTVGASTSVEAEGWGTWDEFYLRSVGGEQTSVTISGKSSYSKTYGDKAFKLDAKASSGNLTYSSSKKSVATVGSTGVVTIKGTGVAVITVSAGSVSKKITITVKPKKVNGVKAKAAAKKAVISWKKDAKAAGYQIQYSTTKNFKKATTVTVKGASKTIKGLKSKKTYYVRVCAYAKNGSKKILGSYGKVLTVKVK